MPQFMLLLHQSTTRPDLSPAQRDAVVRRYVAYADGLRAEGRLVRGDKLKDAPGRVLRKDGLRDGPYAEAKELLGGYYIIEARDEREAVELARGCPHLELGGTIELRELEVVS